MASEKLSTPVEAVTLGLYLAITAPTSSQSRECVELAESIVQSANLSEHQIDTAKALALVMVELESSRAG
jgi:hypothetical protein